MDSWSRFLQTILSSEGGSKEKRREKTEKGVEGEWVGRGKESVGGAQIHMEAKLMLPPTLFLETGSLAKPGDHRFS